MLVDVKALNIHRQVDVKLDKLAKQILQLLLPLLLLLLLLLYVLYHVLPLGHRGGRCRSLAYEIYYETLLIWMLVLELSFVQPKVQCLARLTPPMCKVKLTQCLITQQKLRKLRKHCANIELERKKQNQC